MILHRKKQEINQIKSCYFKVFLFFVWYIISIGLNDYDINAKSKSGIRIKVIKQDIDKKEQIIGCSQKKCVLHKNQKYSEISCISGSDLFNIQVKTKENGKIKYKCLYDMGFQSMQGGCIKNNNLYLAFSDKGKSSPKRKDLTAIVKIDLTKSKVKKVTLVKGAVEKNIDGLGHANDLTYHNNKLHAAWYMTKGTGKKYSNKVGYISTQISGKGTGLPFSNANAKKSAFGIVAYSKNYLALGIRYEGKKKTRYICTYKLKKKKYKKKKKLFTLNKNKRFLAPQCMEYYNKRFFVIRFNTLVGKKNNNCVEIYNKKGKHIITYTIKDPITNVAKTNFKNPQKSKITTSSQSRKLWEIETFSHYKGNTFYYTQFKPSETGNKQAYLYKINLKAKATDKKASKDKKKSKNKKKAKAKKKAKTKTKTKTTKKATTKKKPKTKAKKKTKK